MCLRYNMEIFKKYNNQKIIDYAINIQLLLVMPLFTLNVILNFFNVYIPQKIINPLFILFIFMIFLINCLLITEKFFIRNYKGD